MRMKLSSFNTIVLNNGRHRAMFIEDKQLILIVIVWVKEEVWPIFWAKFVKMLKKIKKLYICTLIEHIVSTKHVSVISKAYNCN